MIDEIVLLINNPYLPPAQIWSKAFRGCAHVRVTEAWSADTDAALTSVMRCDEYGCLAGSTDETLGVMYLFDTWQFEEPNSIYPRILISNAVWRTEPALEIAVEQRMNILASTLAAYNQTAVLPIRSITIECGVLGMWRDYPQLVQGATINRVRALIQSLFVC